jgi:N-sulfoglucosamine sulfohydrolase
MKLKPTKKSTRVKRQIFMGVPLILAFVALSMNCWAGSEADDNPTKPNILLIIADDLGRQLGCYNDKTVKTLYLDKLANEGVRFTNAHVTQASCSPSRGSIVTGLYPHQNGLYGLCQGDWSQLHHLHDNVSKLPNALKKLGYSTAMIGKTHFQPFGQFEFDFVEEDYDKVYRERDVRWMNSQAEKWLTKNENSDPFFLIMSYTDPHRGGGTGLYNPSRPASRNVLFPSVLHGLPENPPTPEKTIPVPFLGVNTPEVRKANSGFYACVQRLDTGVANF